MIDINDFEPGGDQAVAVLLNYVAAAAILLDPENRKAEQHEFAYRIWTIGVDDMFGSENGKAMLAQGQAAFDAMEGQQCDESP